MKGNEIQLQNFHRIAMNSLELPLKFVQNSGSRNHKGFQNLFQQISTPSITLTSHVMLKTRHWKVQLPIVFNMDGGGISTMDWLLKFAVAISLNCFENQLKVSTTRKEALMQTWHQFSISSIRKPEILELPSFFLFDQNQNIPELIRSNGNPICLSLLRPALQWRDIKLSGKLLVVKSRKCDCF